MENLNTASELIKKIFKIGGIIFVFAAIIFYGYPKYQNWQFNRELKKLAEEAKKPYLEDVYGGRTPKETLELFIAAVEKEDFDLASKYFVLSKREEWRNGLMETTREKKMSILMNEVRQAKKEIEKAKPLWEGQNNYSFDTETNIAFDFIKYPSGIWKIQGI